MNEDTFTSSHVLERTDGEVNLVANDAAAEKARVMDATPADVDSSAVTRPNIHLDETVAHPVSSSASVALLDRGEAERLRMRWAEIQVKFVDEPLAAVEEADALVLSVIEKINDLVTQEHNTLESQWKNQGNDISTEELRKSLQRYRTFFNRLVLRAE
jgi:hypothetical protein